MEVELICSLDSATNGCSVQLRNLTEEEVEREREKVKKECAGSKIIMKVAAKTRFAVGVLRQCGVNN